MTELPEVSALKKRLQKAVRLTEKLRKKCDLEKEVNVELGTRNEVLKSELKRESEKNRNISGAFHQLASKYGELLHKYECSTTNSVEKTLTFTTGTTDMSSTVPHETAPPITSDDEEFLSACRAYFQYLQSTILPTLPPPPPASTGGPPTTSVTNRRMTRRLSEVSLSLADLGGRSSMSRRLTIEVADSTDAPIPSRMRSPSDAHTPNNHGGSSSVSSRTRGGGRRRTLSTDGSVDLPRTATAPSMYSSSNSREHRSTDPPLCSPPNGTTASATDSTTVSNSRNNTFSNPTSPTTATSLPAPPWKAGDRSGHGDALSPSQTLTDAAVTPPSRTLPMLPISTSPSAALLREGTLSQTTSPSSQASCLEGEGGGDGAYPLTSIPEWEGELEGCEEGESQGDSLASNEGDVEGAMGAGAEGGVPLFEYFLVVGVPAEAAQDMVAAALSSKVRQLEAESLASRSRYLPSLGLVSGISGLAGRFSRHSGSLGGGGGGKRASKDATSLTTPSGLPPTAPVTPSRLPSTSTTASTPTAPAPTSKSRLGGFLSPSPSPSVAATGQVAVPVPPFSPPDALVEPPSAPPHPVVLHSSSAPSFSDDSTHGQSQMSSQSHTGVNYGSIEVDGSRTCSPQTLFKFPESADPPQEICDFCMPAMVPLRVIPSNDNSADDTIMEIFYGSSQSKRSHRSFVFVVEDQNLNQLEEQSEAALEMGVDSGRMFGICVMQPRLVQVTASAPTGQIPGLPSSHGHPLQSPRHGHIDSLESVSHTHTHSRTPSKSTSTTTTATSTTDSQAQSVASGPSSASQKDRQGGSTGDPEMQRIGSVGSDVSMGGEGLGEGAGLVVCDADVEATVCFVFITRFPLFDFFFRVIYDILALERLKRLDAVTSLAPESEKVNLDLSLHGSSFNGGATSPYIYYTKSHFKDHLAGHGLGSKSQFSRERSQYLYLNTPLLTEVLASLGSLEPPRLGETVRFQILPEASPIEVLRDCPPAGEEERYIRAAAWALPPLLNWLPLDTLLWTIGLLLCEAKVVVIGSEPGMVSCAVMGLLTLLRPLSWVAALIPVLPVKHVEFVESPVPLLAGVVLNEDQERSEHSIPSLLRRCSGGSDGSLAAVLHVGTRNLYVPADYASKYLEESSAMTSKSSYNTLADVASAAALRTEGSSRTSSSSVKSTSSSSLQLPANTASSAASSTSRWTLMRSLMGGGGVGAVDRESDSSKERGKDKDRPKSIASAADRLKANYTCTKHQEEAAAKLQEMLHNQISVIAGRAIHHNLPRKVLAHLAAQKGFDIDDDDLSDSVDGDDGSPTGNNDNGIGEFTSYRKPSRKSSRVRRSQESGNGYIYNNSRSDKNGLIVGNRRGSTDTMDTASVVSSGLTIDGLTPSLIGDASDCEGYEVLALSGVAFGQTDEKHFYKRFTDTQLFVSYKEALEDLTSTAPSSSNNTPRTGSKGYNGGKYRQRRVTNNDSQDISEYNVDRVGESFSDSPRTLRDGGSSPITYGSMRGTYDESRDGDGNNGSSVGRTRSRSLMGSAEEYGSPLHLSSSSSGRISLPIPHHLLTGPVSKSSHHHSRRHSQLHSHVTHRRSERRRPMSMVGAPPGSIADFGSPSTPRPESALSSQRSFSPPEGSSARRAVSMSLGRKFFENNGMS